MVSAPETNWTSLHSRPASCSAARAATMPYSTKLRPHLPQGCMPTPSTTTSLSRSLMGHRLPLPHRAHFVIGLVERFDDQLHLPTGGERRDVGATRELTQHDHLL